MFDAIGADSPARAVKKMRTDDGERVNAWEGRGSPTNRRIVTRGNHSGEELIALEEEEEAIQQDHQEEVLNVEVVNEDGTVEEVAEAGDLAQEEWEDESVADEADADSGAGTATNHDPNHATSIDDDTAEVQPEPQERGEEPHDVSACQTGSEGTTDHKVLEAMVPHLPQTTAIPDGFVSPVKERRRRPISQVRQANANRRRTLPTNFATQPSAIETLTSRAEGDGAVQSESVSTSEMRTGREPSAQTTAEPDRSSEQEAQLEVMHTEDNSAPEPSSHDAPDGEWEDVEDDGTLQPAAREATPEPFEQSGWVETVENTPSSEEEALEDARRYSSQIREQLNTLGSPSKLPSSPIPNIEGQHPRLPLRRSPRRQSTSPFKKGSLRPFDKPHLVAFTPVKMPVYRSTQGDDPFRSSPLPESAAAIAMGVDDMDVPQVTRSSSAPPEEPQMSPQKPKQPRISDDTALLQAFLKRATESKSGTNMSATARRESFENRRNSDTVRQALASPAANVAPFEVLADRDPNSPSPRKQNMLTEAETKSSALQEDQIEFDPLSPGRTSRRSGRSKKTSQQDPPTTSFLRPNKITVRGSQDPIVLKKSEAQELAYLTKANTRKNKGGSVLPPLKLTRMAKDGALEELPAADPATIDVDQPGRKGVKWAETLVAFYEGGNEPAESTMMDELNATDPVPDPTAAADHEMTGVPAVSAPSETPSKPKLRRLKPPRTASTPGKAPPPPAEVPSLQPEQSKVTKPKAPSTTKRRSRLATPAKPKDGVTAAVVDPPKEEGPLIKPIEEKAATEKIPVPKKKPTSRLPAPGSIARPLAQGKENAITASPPKKCAKAPAASDARNVNSAKVFAPKLDFKSSTDAPAPGVASPPKRVARGNLFAGGLGEAEGSAVKGRQEVPPSLGSPAKKRSRRVAG